MGTSAVTLRDMLRGRPTLQQYTILQRADVLLRERCGRYYSGVLSDAECAILKEGLSE
jgi:hypothetical protein